VRVPKVFNSTYSDVSVTCVATKRLTVEALTAQSREFLIKNTPTSENSASLR
jgi:hypothetical protein